MVKLKYKRKVDGKKTKTAVNAPLNGNLDQNFSDELLSRENEGFLEDRSPVLPGNDSTFLMSSFPFQYWEDARHAHDDEEDENIVNSFVYDHADAKGSSQQQRRHLERTIARAEFYRELREYNENLSMERERRSLLSDEQNLREKFDASKSPDDLHCTKPIPPLSQYA